MFSRKERDFLHLLVNSEMEGGTGNATLTEAFPNPAYQRKLMWGIRKKVSATMADMELYLHAAEFDSKVIPSTYHHPEEPHPLAADPLVTVLRRVQTFLHHSGETRDQRGRSAR